MGYHSHYIRRFIRGTDTSGFTLCADRRRESIPIGFANSCLVKANGGGMDIHVGENNIVIHYTPWKSQVIWQ